MTNHEAGDGRRATSLVVHFGHTYLEGINAILAEAVETNRVTPLFVAVLDLHAGIIPILITEDGLACVSHMVYTLTKDDDTDTARAAQLITARDQQDADAFNALMRQAADTSRVTELLLAVLTVFRTVVPQLYSKLGLEVLQQSVLNWAAREDGDDQEGEGK